MFKFNTIILPFLLPSIATGLLRGNGEHYRSLVATGKEDFESFSAGDVVTILPGNIAVTAQKKSGGVLVPGEAMIFDSANPTGGDFE
jgi:hypothetical protein